MCEIIREWLSPNGITALATVLTAIAAFIALKTWRSQIKGQKNYEIVSEIKISITLLKMLIEQYRLLPPSYPIDDSNESNSMDEYKYLFSALNEQRKMIDEITHKTEASLIKAEALIGSGHTNLIIILKLSVLNYTKAIDIYLSYKSNSPIFCDMTFDEAEQILGYKKGEISKKFESDFKNTFDIIYAIDIK